jgi:hypothetical protein
MPFQNILQQHREVTLQSPALTFAHILDFLRDVLDVSLIEATGAEECDVTLSPLEEIAVVKLRGPQTS